MNKEQAMVCVLRHKAEGERIRYHDAINKASYTHEPERTTLTTQADMHLCRCHAFHEAADTVEAIYS